MFRKSYRHVYGGAARHIRQQLSLLDTESNPPAEKRSAVFSADRIYRYTLDIVWDPTKPLCQFIGLNPSTADEYQDDPTVRRCKDFARREGCGGLVMTNIFAYRETDPKGMLAHPAPIGEKVTGDELNDGWLRHTAERCAVHIAAWGVHGEHMGRGRVVANLIHTLQCLGVTKDGHPKHPLYLARTCPLIPFSYQPVAR